MQGTLLSTITFPEFVDLVRRNFVTMQNLVPYKARQLFISDTIPVGSGNSKNYTEYDVETYARNKPEGQAAQKAKIGIGYQIVMTKKRIAMEVDITYEMRTENRYREVGNRITSLSSFCPQRLELDLSHVFSFCNAVSYVDMDGDLVDNTVADGLSITNTAHTLKFSPITYSTRVPADPIFSQGGLEGAESLTVSDILSNFGERRVMSFNTIISTDDPNTCNAIRRLFGSDADVQTSNSGIMNVYKGKYAHVELPYLATTVTGARDATKRKWWGLACIGQGEMGWQAYYGEWEAAHLNDMPKSGNNAEDCHTDTWTFGTRAGYGIRPVSPRGLVMSLAQ